MRGPLHQLIAVPSSRAAIASPVENRETSSDSRWKAEAGRVPTAPSHSSANHDRRYPTTFTLAWRDGLCRFRAFLRASVGSTAGTSDQPASVSSDRSAQRGSRFVGLGEDLNREGILFNNSAVHFLRRKVHSAMRGTGACVGIAEPPPVDPGYISVQMGRDVRIRYSTVGVVPSTNSGDPSSGRP